MAPYHNTPSLDADMDTFLDFNGGGGLQSPTSPVDHLNSMIAPEHADERQAFPGPSHEYGRFKQQTGLPSGAMSTITSFSDLPGDNDFMSQSSSYANNTGYSSIDMGYNSGFNLEMDYETTPQPQMPAYYFPGVTSDVNDFGESSGSAGFDAPPANPPRLWPGMHSQQAQQARAEASARQQQQRRQQQQQLQQSQQIMQQRQREQSLSASSQQSAASRKNRSGSQAGADPVADERISRILDNMRHNSTVSTIDEEQGAMDDAAARRAKMRKEEEDMDEDERLLASEEGKKLSSKERRQLRNKVSARAFRSRRKEYITQLEGEVAAKANEYNELKLENRKLSEENGQLKHLTRTLLSHPAFQSFLEDMSRDPTFIAPVQAPPPPPEPQPPANDNQQGEGMTKQENNSSSSNETQVNMANMPQTSLDFSMLNLGNNHWGTTNPGFNFQQPQVFAVLEVPQGPSYEEIVAPRILSGKTSAIDAAEPESLPQKRSVPRPIDLPEVVSSSTSDATEDAQATLYFDSPAQPYTSSSSSSCTIEITARLLENSLSGKETPTHFPLIVSNKSTEELLCEVETMFDSLESSLRRIESLTWQLSR